MASTSHSDKALVEAGYDAIADEYLAWAAPRPTETRQRLIEELISEIPKGSSILELGCGAGVPCTQFLSSKGFKVTGNDISASQVALAKQHVPNATFLQGDMLTLDIPPSSFDVVLAFYSIFHLPKEEQGQMIALIETWLKPGGKFLANFQFEEGDVRHEGWLGGVTMFSSGLGVEGTRDAWKEYGKGLRVDLDMVDTEYVGSHAEKFHWIMATKASS